MPEYIAYKITCSVNGKSYIGITTVGLATRWKKHRCAAKVSQAVLYRAMRKYGSGTFSVSAVAEAASREELVVLERGLIAAYGTMVPEGFNMTSGGDGMRGANLDPEMIRRRGAKIKEAYTDPERRAQMSIRGKARFSVQSERDRQSQLAKEHANRPEVLMKSAERQHRLFNDPAYVQKIRDGARKFWTPERRKEFGRRMGELRSERAPNRRLPKCPEPVLVQDNDL